MVREFNKFTVILTVGLCAAATTSNASSYREFNESLSSANYVSSLDGARSLGSLGSNFGLTYQQFVLPGDNLFVSGNFDKPVKEKIMLPGIIAAKGFSWPVNVGVGLSYLDKPALTKTFAYIQWTALEGFQTPALAFQVSHSQLSGLDTNEIRSTAGSAHLSYAPLYPFTIFASYGVARHEAVLTNAEQTQRIFIRQNTESEPVASRDLFLSRYHSVGFKALVPATFTSVAAEYQKSEFGKIYLAKLSVGM